MLDDIFGANEIVREEIYREVQKVIKTYMDKYNKKIEYVSQELGTTAGYFRKQIDPNQPDRPLSVDRIIDITRLTHDTRIVEKIAQEVGMLAIPIEKVSASIKDISHLTDIVNMESADVFREVKTDMADKKINADEQRQIIKEIKEAQTALAALENSVKNLNTEE